MDIIKASRVQEMTQSILSTMGFDAHISLREPACEGQGDFICNIRIEEESNLLIGQHGVNLQALQHIIRLLAKKEFEENIAFSLDVNSYWEQKSLALVKEARATAGQVIQNKISVTMRPMTSYERKIVHADLALNPQVSTESIGTNENRKVIVRYHKDESTEK
jgi:spoIIIJ-associated protein